MPPSPFPLQATPPTPPPPQVSEATPIESLEATSTAQLRLPLPELLHSPDTWQIQRQKRVFVNRNLRMSEVDWVGFDMDYTLAIYNQPEMDQLQIRATVPKLIARGYPSFLADEAYDINFPIRGLMIDKELGHVLKMDRYKVVHKACHGLRALGKDELRSLYHQKKIDFASPRYHWIDVLYALSEVAMYATIVDAMERRKMFVDYSALFRDIRECIDEAHRDRTVHDAVISDYPRYLVRDPDLAQTLHKLRSAGKKLFVLTNSGGDYTDRMMSYLLGTSLPGYPSWRHFFDVVIVSAGKPGFFKDRRPLRERDGDTVKPVANGQLERGRIYEGGNLAELERLVGTTGDRVLYVGDHIYGDILRSKKESAWRTAMIIQEMTAEVLAGVECAEDTARLLALEEVHQKSEDELRFLQMRYKEVVRLIDAFASPSSASPPALSMGTLETERARVKKGVERVRTAIRGLESEMTELEQRVDRRFHPYWGSLLKESNEMSSFGKQVEEYACVYTSKVSNLLAYSPRQHFRSPRDRMPHETLAFAAASKKPCVRGIRALSGLARGRGVWQTKRMSPDLGAAVRAALFAFAATFSDLAEAAGAACEDGPLALALVTVLNRIDDALLALPTPTDFRNALVDRPSNLGALREDDATIGASLPLSFEVARELCLGLAAHETVVMGLLARISSEAPASDKTYFAMLLSRILEAEAAGFLVPLRTQHPALAYEAIHAPDA